MKNLIFKEERYFKESMSSWFTEICWEIQLSLLNFNGTAELHDDEEDIAFALKYWYKLDSKVFGRLMSTGGFKQGNLWGNLQVRTPMLSRYSSIT